MIKRLLMAVLFLLSFSSYASNQLETLLECNSIMAFGKPWTESTTFVRLNFKDKYIMVREAEGELRYWAKYDTTNTPVDGMIKSCYMGGCYEIDELTGLMSKVVSITLNNLTSNNEVARWKCETIDRRIQSSDYR